MKIIITTHDPAATRFVEEAVRDGHIGWGCSPECESTSIKIETIVSFSDEAAVSFSDEAAVSFSDEAAVSFSDEAAVS